MPHSQIAVVTLLVLASHGLSSASAQDGKKLPIPSEEKLVEAAKLITGELFKDDIVRAGTKDAAANAKLAKKFLEEAIDTNDDPAGRYMLLNMAVTHALLGGDSRTALNAINEMAHYFILPGGTLQKKIKALVDASKLDASPEAHLNTIESARELIDEAMTEDDYASAQQLFQAAENAARKWRNVSELSAIRRYHAKINDLEKKFARWKPYAETLSKNPDDGPANFAMGVYQALLKGNWDRGLPLLAKANDDRYKTAAALDLADPTAARKQVAAAELWFDLAQKNSIAKIVDDKEFNDGPRIQLLLRAYHWYQDALGSASARESDVIDKSMQKIASLLPPEYAIGELTTQFGVWNLNTGPPGTPTEPVYCAAFSPDSKKVVAANADGMLHLFDVRTGKALRTMESRASNGDSSRIWTVCFSADGRYVISGGFDGSIRLWDANSGKEKTRFLGANRGYGPFFPGHADYVRSVVASRDGKLVLSGGDDRLVRLWSEETGKEVRSFAGHTHFVWCVDLSRNGTRALSASLDRTVRLWDVATGKQLKELRGHKDGVLSVVFTPDGRHALSGGNDKTMILWDLEADKHIVFPALPGYVNSVAVSPDGRRALSGSQDPIVFLPWKNGHRPLPKTLRLWDLHAGKEIRVLEGHTDQVWHVAFSPDGRLALSCGQDGTVRLWSGSKFR